jgi:TIGR03009 family protein
MPKNCCSAGQSKTIVPNCSQFLISAKNRHFFENYPAAHCQPARRRAIETIALPCRQNSADDTSESAYCHSATLARIRPDFRRPRLVAVGIIGPVESGQWRSRKDEKPMRLRALYLLLVALAGCITCGTSNLLFAQYTLPPAGQRPPNPQTQPRSAYAPPPNNQQQGQAQPPSAYAQPPQYAPPVNQNGGPAVRVAQQPPNRAQPGQAPQGQYPVNQAQAVQGQIQGPPLPNYVPPGAPRTQVPGGPIQVRQQVPQRAMFQLTPEQRDQLHRALKAWEAEGDQIKNFACPFQRWEYDAVFGPGSNIPKTKGYGELKYVKPDKGRFQIDKLEHFTPGATPNDPPTYVAKQGEFGEKWVCDGKWVYEYKFDLKKLVSYEIPKEMQGKAIVDGPLPFLFGAKEKQLLARYDMKVTEETDDQVWIDAWPLRREDAANYQHVEVILSKPRMLPTAIQVYMPNGKTRMVYMFGAASVNNALSGIIDWFEQPRTPFGWEKVIERAPAPPPAENRQATQPSQPVPK